MMARLLVLLLSMLTAGAAVAQSPGRLIRYDNVQSHYVEPRGVTVWLPEGYYESDQRYPVLYMQDGQNLFDPATAGPKGEWQVDEAMARLAKANEARPAIIVGVWNTPKRLREYVPAKAVERLPEPYHAALLELYQGTPLSDQYLRFLVEELKPWVDRSFRTLPGRDDTFVAGSSMGGLISLYAVSEYPEVFGGAAAISTHWPLFLTWPLEPRPKPEMDAVVAAFQGWLRESLPSPATHRLYFDYGSETLDSLYEPYQLKMDEVVKAAGYVSGENWVTESYPGAAHEEPSWRARIDVPLKFLLGTVPSTSGDGD
jgi:pimeloyl-ACP methyl ester carboxylesterase